ncbi:MAG: metal dependent phosphohydrolase [Thermomicrobiales bacterium]|nr:metal dependent phosphohydrolase [Thermomicrobiales bacterium]MDF3015312.1 metal dependent phosphohydrolase [Thermomicrobiales bacterium]
MSDLPLKTRVYTVLLVLITAAATAIAWRAEYQVLLTSLPDLLVIAGILLVMIVVAEVLDVSFPQAGQAFNVSVSAAFCFAAGLTIGPVLGGIVAALAHIIDGVIARRQAIKTTVNAAGIGLSTIASAALYFALAEPTQSPIGSYQNLLTVILSAIVYALINSGSLAVIVAPVVGISPFEMWRTNWGGLHVELLTLVTLGSMIPVLVGENPLSIILLIVPMLLGPHTAFRGIQQAHHETRVAMEGLADALERRDPYTYRHSIRVTEHVRTILGAMPQIPPATAEAIIAAAHVHDLGKVGARDGSLKKPGELSDEERQEIEQHAAIGADIVSRLEAYKHSVDTIRHHHERWDGSGYPDGLEGERIPLGARIIAVADAFDAMTSDRIYRAALPVDVAIAELAKGRGTQFDPQIVDLFQAAFQLRVVPTNGEDNDRHGRPDTGLAQHAESIDTGHDQIEDDVISHPRRDRLQRGGAILRSGNGVAVRDQRAVEGATDPRLVADDQHPIAAHAACPCPSEAASISARQE